jgi:hypothetical protein
MGLLDQMPGLDTPEGQGLLSAAFSLMRAQKYPGQKGGIGGAIGEAGQTYLQASGQSRDQMQRRKYLDAQMEQQQMQLGREQAAQAESDRRDAYFRNMGQPQGPAQAMANGQGPTLGNAQRLGQTLQPSPTQVLRDLGPRGLEEFTKINNTLNPKPKYTAYKPGDAIYSDGDMSKPAFSVPEKATPTDYNKPFMPDGTPNKAYQDYSLTKAQRGAANVNVGGSKNIFNQENEQSKAYGKGMGELRTQIQNAGFNAPQSVANLNRMETLLNGVDTGRFAPAGVELAGMARSLGLNIDPKLGNKEAAIALSTQMALAMKPVGSGPMSDKDFDNFLSTVPNLAQSPEGRKYITQTLKAKAQRDVKIAKMARDFAKANNGVLNDEFLDQVAEFVAQNPVVYDGGGGGSDVRSRADAILNGGK